MKLKRTGKEAWGVWEDRSYTLIYHPRHKTEPGFFSQAFVNLVVSVQVSHEQTDWGTVTHLWVRRHDEQPMTWAEMQRIKDELVGAERIGVEVYPAQSALVDAAHIYHLWVLPEGFKLPFGL